MLFNQQATIWLLRQSLHIKTKSFGPQNRNTQIGKAKEGEGEGKDKREREGEEFSILYNFTVIKYYFKIEAKQTDTERETEKGREKGLKPLFVCLSCARCCWIGGNYTFYYDTVRLQSVFCPPHRIAPPCAAHNLYGLQANWHYVALEKTKPRQSDTETETGLVANRSCGKKFKLKPRANRPSACKVNLKRLRRCGDTPHKKLVNDTNVPHEAVDICMYDPE